MEAFDGVIWDSFQWTPEGGKWSTRPIQKANDASSWWRNDWMMMRLLGFQASHGGVIPPNILVTGLKPDLFIVHEASRFIVMVELTCPWDTNVERSHNYKQEKYSPLVADLASHYRVRYYPVEVSVRGQVTKGNKARFKSFIYECCNNPRPVFKLLISHCSKLSLLASFSIFSARKEPTWSSPSPLTVRWFAYSVLVPDLPLFFVFTLRFADFVFIAFMPYIRTKPRAYSYVIYLLLLVHN